LYYDRIQAIGLDSFDLAFKMAKALAVLHWNTKIDGNDIEFVLGSAPQMKPAEKRPAPPKEV